MQQWGKTNMEQGNENENYFWRAFFLKQTTQGIDFIWKEQSKNYEQLLKQHSNS